MSTVLTFITPPPGFEPLVEFALHDIVGANGLYAMQATEDDGTRLFVLDASVYLPEYTPEISDEQSTELDLTTSEDAIVLVVANPADGGTTVNLLAPIVVNAASGRSAQIILEGQDWPLRAELAALAT